ncbi:MAG TPA: hypothetical protein VFK05_23900 [Polyangiaceae bacterium]|nr:hypothetical protein [Polyangiaceae bacterium]
MLSSPIVIHIHRPYASEEEYIARERFSIEAKSMLLIDQPALPIDTAVIFDVTLDNGQKPIRAEAKVVAHVEPHGDQPGGLRVRFRRFGAATKAFIDRAVNGTPAAAPVLEAVPGVAPVAPPALDVRTESAPLQAPSPQQPSNDHHEADEASGIHQKTSAKLVAAPTNREALLARLRGRRIG